MSFLGDKKLIEEDDEVIMYLGHHNMTPLKIQSGHTTQTRYGALKHRDLVGKRYGARIATHGGKGWVFILKPTPELWTVTLPHRTQILYFTDISMITLELELKPGSKVAEAGTGSGSLSHAIARTVAPLGHLYTYEFHKERADKAAEEFKSHGLSGVITAEHRDVIKDGFSDPLIVDAVFLDLPSPWSVVPHAKKILKTSGGRICSFSPCIEQVQRTCEALGQLRFSEIKTVECLPRPYCIKAINFPEPNFGSHQEKQASGEDSSKRETDGGDESRAETDETAEKGADGPAKKRARLNVSQTSKKGHIPGLTCAIPNREIVGHSGYLTFATLNELRTG